MHHPNQGECLQIQGKVISTYLGGAAEDEGAAITTDSIGNTYVVGSVQSYNFPTTTGAYQVDHTAFYNAFVSKFSPDGTKLIFSSYIGGTTSGNYHVGDYGRGIAVDEKGLIYLTGYSSTLDFPTTTGSYQQHNKETAGVYGANAFVSKLTSSGTALVFSTYIGGSNNDRSFALGLGNDRSIFICGSTSSMDYPVSDSCLQKRMLAPATSTTGFVTRLSSDGARLIYSSFLGGSVGEDAYGVAVDSGLNAVVTGRTYSPDFPVTPQAFQITLKSPKGQANGFVTKLNPSGSKLLFSTFLGGAGDDQARAVALDSSGHPYVVGIVHSRNFPVTIGALLDTAALYSKSKGFISKLSRNADSLIYSTYVGGSRDRTYYFDSQDECNGVAVDRFDRAYITGSAATNDFPVTSGAYQTHCNADSARTNIFVSILDTNGGRSHYSTYLGGEGNDVGKAIVCGRQGEAVLTGSTYSRNFPISGGAFATNDPAAFFDHAFVAKLIPVAQSVTTSLRSQALGLSCYPNPASSNARLRYFLGRPAAVSIELQDVLGTRVHLYKSTVESSGEHFQTLNMASLEPGAYFCNLRTGDAVATVTIIVVK
jgi:hypothetical protein